ncbi:hypothetical protein Vretimale_12153 [Volvox reticuliferus]|uniref:Uncharacterized protein n=1 Tax=Volvox reticuliferus TaxID=1737510 RepID=A0A8J4D3I0_9CHLO|nr:hypothetical protein Vretifemale_19749 [Volvox reticuliferus]GIL92182.1 hypothetical protein Vretifemale_19753 [Volvox reticuliferus]GIM08091.1 hypothetical protein Vretimale_12153 [Volvox reticuliferus]
MSIGNGNEIDAINETLDAALVILKTENSNIHEMLEHLDNSLQELKKSIRDLTEEMVTNLETLSLTSKDRQYPYMDENNTDVDRIIKTVSKSEPAVWQTPWKVASGSRQRADETFNDETRHEIVTAAHLRREGNNENPEVVTLPECSEIAQRKGYNASHGQALGRQLQQRKCGA